jgi:ATP synthase protein I
MAQQKKGIGKYLKYSTIGIELGAAITIGALLGSWLDAKLGTEPWMFLFWLLCGMVAGFRSLYRMAKKYLKETREDEHQGSD